MDKKKLFCNIAGIQYEIEYQYPYLKTVFKDYIISSNDISEKEMIKIMYSEEDIQRIRGLFEENRSAGYIEYMCIMDKVATLLPNQGMFLMHGAAIEYDNQAYLFTAPSGTGKSTHISLWKKYLGEKVNIINGDKPEISFDNKKVYVHGAPWCGKEGWQMNKSVPLAAVCLLKQGSKNKIEKINPGKIIEVFMSQLYFSQDNESILKVIDLFAKMVERIPFYTMECDISMEAVKCSFEMLTGRIWENENKRLFCDT